MTVPPANNNPRELDGIINIRKPIGWSSNDVIRWLKKRSRRIKIGHAGTLDPFADGVLLVCFGRSTKDVPRLMALEKEYIARIRFGGETDTLDVTGRVVQTCAVPHFSAAQLEKTRSRFLGEIEQIPPTFSAIRIKGKRAYQLARNGQTISMKSRRVRIHELEISSKSDTECDLRVICSKGTYIRSLARDIAKTLGTAGYVKKLTRTRIGHYKISSSLELSDLAAQLKNSCGYESILGHR